MCAEEAHRTTIPLAAPRVCCSSPERAAEVDGIEREYHDGSRLRAGVPAHRLTTELAKKGRSEYRETGCRQSAIAASQGRRFLWGRGHTSPSF